MAYLRQPSSREYYLATAAGRIYMPPEDLLDLKGLRAELAFFRGTLDKIGVQVEITHAGKYKDFGDMFTRTSMTPETREVLNGVLDELYGDLIRDGGGGRKKTPEQTRAMLDEGPFLSRQALEKGLVDSLLYEDQVFSEVAKQAGAESLTRVSPQAYLRELLASEAAGSRNRVALVVGEGSITRGSGTGLRPGFGHPIGQFVKLLRQVGQDRTFEAP